MTEPLVSCVVPVYQGERFLRQAIDSVLAQTWRPVEVIVVDDASTDGSVAVARSYEPRVRCLTTTRPTGPAATRNRGIRDAVGEYVAFLDADDLWHPEKLERQVARFRARPELGASVAHVSMFWDEDAREEEARLRDHPRAHRVPGFATTCLLARRSAFDRVGLLDERRWFSDSTDWFRRAERAGLVVEVLPEVLTFRRRHRESLTVRKAPEAREEFALFVKESLDRRRDAAARGEPDAPGRR